jgi:hypothetical protein
MEVCFSEQDYLDVIELHHLTAFHLIYKFGEQRTH